MAADDAAQSRDQNLHSLARLVVAADEADGLAGRCGNSASGSPLGEAGDGLHWEPPRRRPDVRHDLAGEVDTAIGRRVSPETVAARVERPANLRARGGHVKRGDQRAVVNHAESSDTTAPARGHGRRRTAVAQPVPHPSGGHQAELHPGHRAVVRDRHGSPGEGDVSGSRSPHRPGREPRPGARARGGSRRDRGRGPAPLPGCPTSTGRRCRSAISHLRRSAPGTRLRRRVARPGPRPLQHMPVARMGGYVRGEGVRQRLGARRDALPHPVLARRRAPRADVLPQPPSSVNGRRGSRVAPVVAANSAGPAGIRAVAPKNVDLHSGADRSRSTSRQSPRNRAARSTAGGPRAAGQRHDPHTEPSRNATNRL